MTIPRTVAGPVRGPRRAGRRRRFLLIGLLNILVACGPEPLPSPASPGVHPRHVLLITAQGLRADALGGLEGEDGSITPRLDELLASSDGSGTAIASSPDTGPALVTVLTGLAPWQHQTLHDDSPRLATQVYSLAESFRDRGYSTTAAISGHFLAENSGFLQGFQASYGYWQGARIRRHLSGLSEEPTFTWVHLDEPQPPYLLNPAARRAPGGRVTFVDLEPFRNPATSLSESQRALFWRGYERHVSRLDRDVGRLLDGLRASGQWDDSMVVFISVHGEEFGEDRQIGHGNNMGRRVLEVPWAIKLPRGLHGRALHSDGRPSVGRIVSTLLEASGALPPPALQPSLFQEGADGALSERYLGNGINQFSLVKGDLQLVRTVRFARPERRYYLVRRQLLGDPRVGSGDTARTEALFDRLRSAFDTHLPFTAPASAVENVLLRWSDTGTSPEDERSARERLGAEMASRWSRSLDRERTPREEREIWRKPSIGDGSAAGQAEKNRWGGDIVSGSRFGDSGP